MEYNEIMQAHQSLEQEEDKSVELFGAEVDVKKKKTTKQKPRKKSKAGSS
jgi:hypothetical protein